ncbi:MAG: hypothetical protein EBR02_03230 [Alphaproteobacteria bacterium]|nr:hypothetical protein [Alphaproteobacteria bacterium]
MDDKTFVASYVAQEAVRINERLKKIVDAESTPSEEEKDSILADIETTLARLQSAVAHLGTLALREEQLEMEDDE